MLSKIRLSENKTKNLFFFVEGIKLKKLASYSSNSNTCLPFNYGLLEMRVDYISAFKQSGRERLGLHLDMGS